jgi:hypothetical protein
MFGTAKRIGVAVIYSGSVLDVEIIVGQCVEPSLRHPDWILHCSNPEERAIVNPEEESAVLEVVSPLSHEDNGRGQLSFGRRIVGLGFRQLLCAVRNNPLSVVLLLGQHCSDRIVFLGPIGIQDKWFRGVELWVRQYWRLQ